MSNLLRIPFSKNQTGVGNMPVWEEALKPDQNSFFGWVTLVLCLGRRSVSDIPPFSILLANLIW